MKIFNGSHASITKDGFNQLLRLRKEFEHEGNTVLAIDRNLLPWWLIIVSKDAKIVYPFTYEGEKAEIYHKNYILKETDNIDDYVFYEITRQNNSLVLKKSASLQKEKYGFFG